MQRGGTTDACRFSGSARLPLPKLSLLKLLESGFYLSAYIPQRALYKHKQAMLTNWHGLLLVRLHSSMQGSFDPKCAVVVYRQQSSKQVVCFCLLSALAAVRCVLWFANASKQCFGLPMHWRSLLHIWEVRQTFAPHLPFSLMSSGRYGRFANCSDYTDDDKEILQIILKINVWFSQKKTIACKSLWRTWLDFKALITLMMHGFDLKREVSN